MQSPVVSAPFPGVLVHKRFYLYPPRVESLFPQSCGNPIIKSCWPWKSDSLRIPSPFVRSPGWEAWCWAQNLHKSQGTSLVLFFSSLWVTHVLGMGSDFYRDCTPQPSHCGFSFIFGHRVSFFGGFQHRPVNGRSIASCDFGVLKEGNEHMSYFTIFHKFYYNVSIVTLCLIDLIFIELHGSMGLYFWSSLEKFQPLFFH